MFSPEGKAALQKLAEQFVRKAKKAGASDTATAEAYKDAAAAVRALVNPPKAKSAAAKVVAAGAGAKPAKK